MFGHGGVMFDDDWGCLRVWVYEGGFWVARGGLYGGGFGRGGGEDCMVVVLDNGGMVWVVRVEVLCALFRIDIVDTIAL